MYVLGLEPLYLLEQDFRLIFRDWRRIDVRTAGRKCLREKLRQEPQRAFT
jgi:hypothetical protein